jgi:integrase
LREGGTQGALFALPALVPELASYDVILVNISGGKDSQAALDETVRAAGAAGVRDRIVTVFCDLGAEDEWPGTRELAAEHAAFYQLRHEVVCREVANAEGERVQQTLSEHIEQRGMWPDAARRYCTVICTNPVSWIMALHVVIREVVVDLRRQLMEGRVAAPRIGSVAEAGRPHLRFVVLNDGGIEVEPVSQYLKELALGDCSPLTCRSYAQGLLRWFRLLWVLEVGWERATESEVAVMVAWLRAAPNPQRARSAGSPAAGSVNLVTGKPALGPGYAKRTINHALSVVSGFYEFHAHQGRGPVINPVPSSAQRRRAMSHLSPLEPTPEVGRARLRQKVPDRLPRAIPDERWDELFAAMGCERDRALLEFSVSSGARAAELLGVTPEDVDWAGRQIYVISKGTRRREPVPASPQAFIHLAHYLDQAGTPRPGEPLWRTRRGPDRPLSYWALRRILQRAGDLLGANWSWHDMRHTAACRMAASPELTLPEVQAIMRHASIQTTSRYLAVRVEELFDKLTEHYSLPRLDKHYPAGYGADDIAAVFGAGGSR